MTADELAARIRNGGHVVTLSGDVSSQTAAAVLGVSAGTLRNWRSSGDEQRGPAYRRQHGRCWYSIDDLAAWLRSSVHEPS